MKLSAWACLLLTIAAPAQSPPVRLNPADVAQHRGDIATVCGLIETFACIASEGTTLTFERQPQFRIVIPHAARAGVEKRIEERFVDRVLCVTGRIEPFGQGDQIAIGRLEDIAIEAESPRRVFAPHAYRYGCDAAVIAPRLTTEQKPAYTRVAMSAGVQGAVWVEAVVEMDGTIGDAQVTKSLRRDLDEQAVLALKEWQFEPATRDGRPVAALITVEMKFTLKS